MTKDEIRLQIRRKLAVFSGSREKSLHGLKLAESMFSFLGMIPEGSCAAVYLSAGNELPTDSLIRILRVAGFRIAVPAWSQDDSCYRYSLYPYGMELCRGRFGIREPLSPRWIPSEDIRLFVVPGIAFSRDGGRLGHGGGWYDRMLSSRSASSITVGVGYGFQILDFPVPREPHDIAMDYVVGVSI